MFGGIGMARAEEDREQAEHDGHDEGEIAEKRWEREGRPEIGDERGDAGRDRLQLERNIRNGSDDGDQRCEGCDPLVLAITRGDEVGDRRDSLGLRELHELLYEGRREKEDQHRADIDGEETDSVPRSGSDRPIEGP